MPTVDLVNWWYLLIDGTASAESTQSQLLIRSVSSVYPYPFFFLENILFYSILLFRFLKTHSNYIVNNSITINGTRKIQKPKGKGKWGKAFRSIFGLLSGFALEKLCTNAFYKIQWWTLHVPSGTRLTKSKFTQAKKKLI